MTISDFNEIWWVYSWPWKKIIPKILDFLVKCGPKYGSPKFHQNTLTRLGQGFVSQLLWDLQGPFLYQMKGIWKIYLYKYSRNFNNNKQITKNKSNPVNLDHKKTYFFFFLNFSLLIDLIIVYNVWKNWNGVLPSFFTVDFWIKTELAIFAKHRTLNDNIYMYVSTSPYTN